jgi:hypothetical protein
VVGLCKISKTIQKEKLTSTTITKTTGPQSVQDKPNINSSNEDSISNPTRKSLGTSNDINFTLIW